MSNNLRASDARQQVRSAVLAIKPFDALEQEHVNDVLSWIDSSAPVFRTAKPDTPPKHLVAYFVLFDEAQNQIMLIDHLKAKAWLPAGGHIELNEDPKTTVIREAKEELAIDAEFSTRFGDKPLFITVTTTRGSGSHTDVTLWYVIRGDIAWDLQFDTREMSAYRWFTFREVLTMDVEHQTDPHMHRFVTKLLQTVPIKGAE